MTNELTILEKFGHLAVFKMVLHLLKRIKTICFLKIHNIHFKSKKYDSRTIFAKIYSVSFGVRFGVISILFSVVPSVLLPGGVHVI